MLSLKEAHTRLQEIAPSMSASEFAISGGMPRGFAASDHHAIRTQPQADLSAMDGYAICGDGPWERIGESRAGAPFGGALKPGQCVRISTGAHMPEGSDRVLIQEEASTDGASISAEDVPPPNRHVRKAGFDFHEGDLVLRKGVRLGPASLALAIAAGLDRLQLVNAPKVAVLDSGDELAPVGIPPRPNQIPASNGTMIGSMLHPYVGEVNQLGPVTDELGALAVALADAEDCDILITSGGASVGDHDLMQEALKAWGAEIDFWKVAIKPGKPLMVARRESRTGSQVILGLPGNPVSSFVTCFLFALPLVRAAMGDPNPLPQTIEITAAQDFAHTGSRHEFLRGMSDGRTVHLAASQDSSALQALASANCLVDRPPDAPAVKIGEPVSVYCLHNG
ncbi:Molybdopterin molybdenumtransferase [Erythrobacter sp. THAF29]|nr:Molybdopterin molybdenumtransferase [Erythrobacter sp. THAF29]